MSPVVTNIQRFSIHDGPGIRTTIFFKGCSLHCPWCANPETISQKIEYYVKQECCMRSYDSCPYNPNCSVCKNRIITSADYIDCKINAIIRYGYEISNEEIMELIERDSNYYNNGGGVTFSGGEPLLQLGENLELLSSIHNKYHTAIETSLSTKKTELEKIDDFIDLYIIDLKTMIEKDYRDLVHGNLDVYKENIHTLTKLNRASDTIFRIPFIEGYTNKQENIDNINNLLEEYSPIEMQIFTIHDLASSKYRIMGLEQFKYSSYEEKNLHTFLDSIHHNNKKILKL